VVILIDSLIDRLVSYLEGVSYIQYHKGGAFANNVVKWAASDWTEFASDGCSYGSKVTSTSKYE
jgi:hypothetical protein